MGISFNCPCCLQETDPVRKFRIVIWLAHPLDGGLPQPDELHWRHAGSSLRDVSLFPSIDASAAGHWHGFVRNGKLAP